MKKKNLWLLAASLAGLMLLPLLACDAVYDSSNVQKYAAVRGTVRIPAALAPLLPSEAAEGETMRAGAPGNCIDTAYELPTIVADSPALVVKGDIAPMYLGGSCEPSTVWLKFQVNKKASISMKFDWDNAAVDGFVPMIYDNKAGSNMLDFLMWDLSGEAPVTLSFVANPTSTYYLRWLKWFSSNTPTGYKISIGAVSGTVVGKILVGAYVDSQPFKIVPAAYANDGDPEGMEDAGKPKNPVGGTTARDLRVDESTCNADGNCDLVGWFDGLLIPIIKCNQQADCIPPICNDLNLDPSDPLCATSPCKDGYCAYNVVAIADNDSGNTLNFSINGPPTTADFVTAGAMEVPNANVDLKKGWKLYTLGELKIDTAVADGDFDGVVDFDRNGDGIVDDNCPAVFNPNQTDSDGDGVGDLCDNCIDTPNADQANSDGIGPGDECNGGDDADGDEIEDSYVDEDNKGDNCPGVANADQADLDNDGLGDACDSDIDNDGILNDADQDNCPDNANHNQNDADADGVGDACDNCRGGLGACLPGITLDKSYDNARDEWDAKWEACELVATMALSECGALNEACLAGACSDCNPGAADCYAANGCTKTNVDACDTAQDRCDALCVKYPSDREDLQKDCHESCQSKRNSCVGAGGCHRKDFDRCMICTDLCQKQCADYDAYCLDNGALCSGADCSASNAGQLDSDGDGLGDACDADDDGDGVLDADEVSGCELLANGSDDTDGDGIPDGCDDCVEQANAGQADADDDGVGDLCDNCPALANPVDADSGVQLDADSDGLGDECDPDDDGDGVCDPDQAGAGCTGVDSCPSNPNPRPACTAATALVDCAGAGDVCAGSVCIAQLDSDGDGIGDECDNCPADANAGQEDVDGDGVGNVCDNCPAIDNGDQLNTDGAPKLTSCETSADCAGGTYCIGDVGAMVCKSKCETDFDCPEGFACSGEYCDPVSTGHDTLGDACDPDDDGDGICDPDVVAAGCTGSDNCPLNRNPDQSDSDGNGIGDICDVDTDGDGQIDGADACPDVPTPLCSALSPCAAGECKPVERAWDPDAGPQGEWVEVDRCTQHVDSDSDGLGDICDPCPNDETNDDTDGDGIGDACGDICPAAANTIACTTDADCVLVPFDHCIVNSRTPQAGAPDTTAGICAGQLDSDSDSYGDACDSDDDNDGAEDTADNCPLLANADQADEDADGVGTACDNCPATANASQSNVDGDAFGDACDPDADNDGVLDDGDGSGTPGDHPCTGGAVLNCDDNCPLTPNADQADVNGNGTGDACEQGEVVTDLFEEEDNALANPQDIGIVSMGYDYRMTGYCADASNDGASWTGDWDVYQFQVDDSGTFKAKLHWTAPDSDYDAILLMKDPPGETPGWYIIDGYLGANAGFEPTEITMAGVEPGYTYGIAVLGWEGGEGIYTVDFGFNFVKEVEPNDTGSTAQDIGTFSDGYGVTILGNSALIQGDDDLYLFFVDAPGKVSYQLNWDDQTAGSDYDIILYDGSTGQYIDGGAGATTARPEVVQDIAVSTGVPYLLFVNGYAGEPGDYQAYISFTAD
ncbi:MAG TPA: thrombospondin type 3 repeat-containing protein [Myxococcota bacterium]|nr:thrombospondin type 3 repeat-containing protein [Myxococcota bacterium]